jgi:hypothetical protein
MVAPHLASFEKEGYSLTVIGHSLGAGIATIFSVLRNEKLLNWKQDVCCATTSSMSGFSYSASTWTASNGGVFTLDGVTTAGGDRVLIKDEADVARNGIFTVHYDSGNICILTRGDDAHSTVKMVQAAVLVQSGSTANADRAWVLTDDGSWAVFFSPRGSNRAAGALFRGMPARCICYAPPACVDASVRERARRYINAVLLGEWAPSATIDLRSIND